MPRARLLVVGDGPGTAGLQARAAALGIADAVEFRGRVPESQIEDVWAETDLLAMPSRGEGFGLVYIEAMRHGIPVIASTHDAGQEVNVHGETGYNVDLDRPGELVESVVTLLRSPDMMRSMGKAGAARWQTLFRYGVFKKRLLEALAS